MSISSIHAMLLHCAMNFSRSRILPRQIQFKAAGYTKRLEKTCSIVSCVLEVCSVVHFEHFLAIVGSELSLYTLPLSCHCFCVSAHNFDLFH
jgi:hypothetical protein